MHLALMIMAQILAGGVLKPPTNLALPVLIIMQSFVFCCMDPCSVLDSYSRIIYFSFFPGTTRFVGGN